MQAGREVEREDFLADVVDLAFHSAELQGWAEVTHYRFTNDAAPHGGDDARGVLLVKGESHEATPQTLNAAYKRLRNDPDWRGDRWARRMLDARRDNDAERVSGRDAAWLVHLGLFGSID